VGQSNSWIGIRGLPKSDILERLDVRDSGRADDGHSAKLAAADLKDGWVVIRSRNFNFPNPRRLALLSQGAELVSAQIEEHVMVSAAHGFREGRQIWSIVHDPGKGLYSLVVEGEPPAQFSSLSERRRREQDAAGGEDADVDMIFDIVPELASMICGYRPDQAELPAFTELEPQSRGLAKMIGEMLGRR
jgi:hypothetical protein